MNCNFKEQADEISHYRVVLGINENDLHRELLEKDVDLDDSIKFGRATGLSKIYIKELQEEDNSIDEIRNRKTYLDREEWQCQKSVKTSQYNRFQRKYRSQPGCTGRNEYFNCKSCGGYHGPKYCPAFGEKSGNCHLLNHLQKS